MEGNGASRPGGELAATAERLLTAFSAGDLEAFRPLLADDLVACVTNADGGVDRIVGADEYLARVEAMDLASARFSIEPTQVPVPVGDGLVLLMVEIRAEREGRTLHNFAAHLLEVADGKVGAWWMVDAKPEESDRFWARAQDRSHGS